MEIDRRTFLGSFVATLVFQRGWFDPGALPPCPPGFEWTRSPALEAFVPCPQGWHFQETVEPGSKMAYFTGGTQIGGSENRFTICSRLIPSYSCAGIRGNRTAG